MKKLGILLLLLAFFSSCKSKRHTQKKYNHTKTRKTIRDRKRTATNTKATKEVVVDAPKQPKIIYARTILNDNQLNNIYANRTDLDQAKVAYIKKFGNLAVHEMETYKIPASITLAQGLLESRYGKSYLTIQSKNHFGIKCHNWKGKRVYHDDDAKGECFRKYDYDENSYRDHSLFLATKKRYKKLFSYAPTDYKSWAHGLRKAGYATDKRYPKKLISLIEEYELYRFDKFVLGDNYKEPIKNNKEIVNAKIHIVLKGETLYSISGDYYVSVADLKQFNKLNGETISIGQKIYLYNPNKRDGIQNVITHTVVKGDTIYSITRKYNILKSDLIKLNNLESNTISIGQELIIK